MAEPTTYVGYKVGTLIALIMGAGVAGGLSPGPWYVRLFAAIAGGSVAFVATPIFAPMTVKMFEQAYGWIGVPLDQVPVESVIGFTGFGLALIGIDACRWGIDASKKIMAKVHVSWPSKPKQ